MIALQQGVAIGPAVFTLNQILLGFAYFVALIAGYFAGLRREVSISDALIKLVLASLIVARIVFIIRYWNSYDGVLAMLDIRDGGFDAMGALTGGLGYAAWTLWHTPRIRAPLTTALLSGFLAWAIIATPLMILAQQSRPLPEVTLNTLAGEQIYLPQYAQKKDKPIVINLWATWCPHCVSEMSMFAKAQKEEEDVLFIFANQGEPASQVTRFMAQKSLPIDNLLLDPHNRLGQAIGSKALPTTLFYDQDGQLVDSRSGRISRARLESGLERLR
jgi:thiol-disulfide isomerase/thioredoxin